MTNLAVAVQIKADGSGLVGEAKAGKTAVEQLSTAFDKNKGSAGKATDGLKAVERQTGKTAQKLNNTRKAANDAGSASKVLASGFNRAANSASVLNGPLNGVSGRLSAVATGLGSVGVVGLTAAAGLTAVTIALAKSVSVVDQYNRGLLRTEALLRATGGSSGLTADDLESLASTVALNTLASVEGVRSASQALMTFRSIQGDVFKDTLVLAQDLSVVMGQDLRSSTVQLAKALEDPIAGINSLKRVGVSFTASQKSMIASLYETGNVAGAQREILNTLAMQVAGVASAEAGGSVAGAADTLSQRWDEMLLALGKTAHMGENVQAVFTLMAKGMDEASRKLRLFNGGLIVDDQRMQEVTRKLQEERAALKAISSEQENLYGGMSNQEIAALPSINPFGRSMNEVMSLNAQYAVQLNKVTALEQEGRAIQKARKEQIIASDNAAKKAAENRAKEVAAEQKANRSALALENKKKAQAAAAKALQTASARYADTLKRQITLHGQTGEAAKLNYELQHGALKGISSQQAAALTQQAQKLDAIKAEEAAQLNVIKALENKHQLERSNKTAIDQLGKQTSNELQGASPKNDFSAQGQSESQTHSANLDQLQNYGASLPEFQYQERARVNQLIEQEQERDSAVMSDINKKGAETEARQTQQTLSITSNALGQGLDALKAAGKEKSGLYKAMFIAQKASSIASSIIATEAGAAEALKMGPYIGPVLAGLVKTMGYASVGAIAGQSLAGIAHNGIDRVPQSHEGTWMLRKDEMVLNPAQRENFEYLTDNIKQQKGGASAMPKVVVNLHQAAEGTKVEQRMQDGELILEIIQTAKEAAVDEVASQVESREGRIGRAIA